MVDTLADEIIKIVQAEANNNPAPVSCTIKKVYDDDKYADIEIGTGVLNYVRCIGKPRVNEDGVLVFFNESRDDYAVITGGSSGGGSGAGVVMVGSFRINDEGHLIVTLPTGTLNPYHIDENGHLIYSTNPQIGGK